MSKELKEISKQVFGEENLTDIVGIDFGTQNIRLQLFSNCNSNQPSEPVIPASVVFDDDKILVGIREASTTKYAENRVFYYLKAFTGIKPSDENSEALEELVRFPVEKNEEKHSFFVNAKVKDQDFKLTGEDLLAIFFKYATEMKRTVRDNVQDNFGCIIAVPVRATKRQRTAIENAAKGAGFKHVKLYSTAAIAAISKIGEEPALKLVSDFGFCSGFTLVECNDKNIEIKRHKDIPLNELNGDKFNQILYDLYASSQKPSDEFAIKLECEENKRYLSTHENAYIGNTHIQRRNFVYKSDDLSSVYEDKLNDFIDEAEFEPDTESTGIVCIGNEMNIPFIAQKLLGAFGKEDEEMNEIVGTPGNVVIDNIFKVGEYTINEIWDKPQESGEEEEAEEEEEMPEGCVKTDEEIKKTVEAIETVYKPKPKPKPKQDTTKKHRRPGKSGGKFGLIDDMEELTPEEKARLEEQKRLREAREKIERRKEEELAIMRSSMQEYEIKKPRSNAQPFFTVNEKDGSVDVFNYDDRSFSFTFACKTNKRDIVEILVHKPESVKKIQVSGLPLGKDSVVLKFIKDRYYRAQLILPYKSNEECVFDLKCQKIQKQLC